MVFLGVQLAAQQRDLFLGRAHLVLRGRHLFLGGAGLALGGLGLEPGGLGGGLRGRSAVLGVLRLALGDGRLPGGGSGRYPAEDRSPNRGGQIPVQAHAVLPFRSGGLRRTGRQP